MNSIAQTTPAHDTQTALVPTFQAVIGGIPMTVCDARTLHAFLGNGELFAAWFKARLEKYGFQENQDFAIAMEKTIAKRGGHNRIDYHLTLGTAKELSMVENNEQGKLARRYFIDMERRALEAAWQIVPHNHIETLIPSEQQTLSEIVHVKVARLPDELKGKALAEIWSRLHHKFRVAKYSQLARTQLSEAIVYVTGMELRSVPQTAPEVPEYLSHSDMQNIKRIIWMLANALHYREAWVQGVWFALRKRCDLPSPRRFEVRHLPLIAEELRLIAQVAHALKDTLMRIELAAIKQALRQGAELQTMLASLDDQYAQSLRKNWGQDNLPHWIGSDFASLVERRALPHGAYYGCEEMAA